MEFLENAPWSVSNPIVFLEKPIVNPFDPGALSLLVPKGLVELLPSQFPPFLISAYLSSSPIEEKTNLGIFSLQIFSELSLKIVPSNSKLLIWFILPHEFANLWKNLAVITF